MRNVGCMLASRAGSKASAPARSLACPGVRGKPVGFPKASQLAWILVVNPPFTRPRHSVVLSPLVHRRRAGGRGRWESRSWRIRCPPLRPDVRKPFARPRSPTTFCGDGECSSFYVAAVVKPSCVFFFPLPCLSAVSHGPDRSGGFLWR